MDNLNHVFSGITALALMVAGFFLKHLYDDIKKGAKQADVVNLAARIDAFEELLSNFQRDQHRENGVMATEMKWIRNDLDKVIQRLERRGRFEP